MTIKKWKELGNYLIIDKHRVFYTEYGSVGDPIILFLHGYPTSSYDYYQVVKKLSHSHRLILHDHIGFGNSDKPKKYSYSLKDQAIVALKIWQKLGIKKAYIIAHDYGTSVLTEILALRSEGVEIIPEIECIILTNGSIHIELAQLRYIQKLLLNKITGPVVSRLVNKKIFIRNMRRLWFDTSKISDHELADMWSSVSSKNGKYRFHKITQYIKERYTYWDRWIGSLINLDIPCLILWAENDPVAVKSIGQKLHGEIPNSQLVWLKETGHFPMLERSEEWCREVIIFLNKEVL